MMGIQDDIKPTKASLLTRSLAPSLDTAIKELIFEENPRPTHHISYSDRVLAIPSSPLQQPIDTFTAPPWTNSGRSIPLSPQRVLAASSIMPARTYLYCGNHNAIHNAHKDIFIEKTKHIEIDCQITHHHLKKGTFQLYSISPA